MPDREPTLPIPLTLLVCDNAHRDPATGKFTLLGLFNSIQAGSYPAVHPFMTAYLAMSDLHGPATLRFQVVDNDEVETVLYRAEISIEVDNPRTVAEIVVPIQGIEFPHGGEYRLQAFVWGQFLIERRIFVLPE